MIDTLATAPQTISGFAEASRKTITFRVVKCECCSLWQKPETFCGAVARAAQIGVCFHTGENQPDLLPYL